MNKQITWRTEKRRVSDLLPYEGNPRVISDKQLETLKKSLEKFSLAEIPAINLDNTVLAGNQRLKALQLLGKGNTEIDVRVPSRKLTKKEAEEYLLTSNRSGGSWDWEALRDFPVDLLMEVGFDDHDLSHIWDDSLEIEDDNFDEDKELEKARETDIKPGDYFALDEHRLICSDATDPKTVQKLVGDTKIDAVNVDCPYNIGLNYNSGFGGKASYGGKTDDKKTDADYREFVSKIIANAISVCGENAHVCFWSDERYLPMMQELYKEYGIDFKRLCLWIKGSHNPTPQVAFNKAVEYCTYGVIGRPHLADNVKNITEIMNKEVGTGSRQIDDILDLLNIWLVKRIAGTDYEHPTQKPPTLHEKFLRRCTRVGDTILDLTAGSGSLLPACHQMKRRLFMAEIEPIFTQLIINRYEQLTNDEAIKLN